MTEVAAETAPAQGGSPDNPQSEAQPVVKPASEPAKPSVKVISPEKEKAAREYRPSLPGLVHDRNDVLDDVFLPRGKDGKFMSREAAEALAEREISGEDDDDTPAPKRDVAPPLPAGQQAKPVAKGKYVFDGEEYESEEAFKQNIKSLRGQYKSFDQNRSKLISDRDYGYETGWKWKAESEKKDEIIKALEQRLGGSQTPATGQMGGQPNGTQPNAQTGATAVVPTVDQIITDDLGREFERRAISHGLPDAGKFLVQSTLRAVMENVIPTLRQELRNEIQPLQQTRSDQQAYEGVQQTIRAVSELRHPNGGPAFPEVENGDTIRAVAQMWVDSGHPRETAFTQHGLIAAISLYRTMMGFGSQPVVPIPKQPPKPNGNASAPAATLDASGEHSAPPNAGRVDESQSPGARALIAALSMNEPMVDPLLGFARNKKR